MSRPFHTALDQPETPASGLSHDEIGRLIDISPLPIFRTNAEGIVTAIDDDLCRDLGREHGELVGKSFTALIAAPAGAYRHFRVSDLPRRGSFQLVAANGDLRHAELFSHPLADGGALVFVLDLTDRKKAEDERLESERKRWQSDRIEALGRLAGGVAHDFNNFLAVLLLHVDILNLHLDDESPVRGRVAEIKDVANSIAGTVRQLFAFGRKQPMTLAPSGLNPVVEQFAEDLRPALADIEIKTEVESALGVCFVDQGQIAQVLKNLAANARDAMPNGGTLAIATANVTVGPGSVQPAGSYVQISVSDTGVGMEPATAEHIFEPFFSTKESDKGAGLALAMVYGIVKQSKGYIWVDTEPGRGTTFRIQFPRIDAVQPKSAENENTASSHTGPRTVLLVDDEPAVRRVTAEFLEMSGYKVIAAGSGMEALELAQACFDPIHLLLTDLSMPLMDGRQTAEKISRLHPETAVLYMSGNSTHHPATTHPANFIAKPFTLNSLTDKIRIILETHLR